MGNGYGANKDIQKMMRKAEKTEGWKVEITKNNHIRFLPPQGEIIIAGLTPNDSGVLQTRKRLRRAGLAV